MCHSRDVSQPKALGEGGLTGPVREGAPSQRCYRAGLGNSAPHSSHKDSGEGKPEAVLPLLPIPSYPIFLFGTSCPVMENKSIIQSRE